MFPSAAPQRMAFIYKMVTYWNASISSGTAPTRVLLTAGVWDQNQLFTQNSHEGAEQTGPDAVINGQPVINGQRVINGQHPEQLIQKTKQQS